MPNDRSLSLRVLSRLKPAKVFLDAYTSPPLPEDLSIFFRAPEYFWSLKPPKDFKLVALLDDGSDEVVTFYDPETSTIVTKDLQDIDNDIERFASWNQFLGSLLITIIENGGGNANLPRIAELICFKDLERVLDFVRSSNGCGANYKLERQRFIATL